MNDSNIKIIRELLSAVAEFFDDQREKLGTVKFYELLAGKLSRVVHKEPAWGWRYVQGVHAGTIKPSKLFATAVQALGAALDEVPVVMTYTVQLQVFARPGMVQPGAVILGQSKTCARAGCRVVFVPNVPWRRYCSPECSALANGKGG